MKSTVWTKTYENRRRFVGGSDTRIIMGSDESALTVCGGRSGERPSLKTCPAT